MAHAQAAILPPALRQAGFFAQLGRVGEEDLAGDGEHIGVVEAFQQRREEIGRHPHIAVQQDHDVVFRRAESGVGAAAESQVARQRHQLDLRETGADKLRAAICGAVVHHHDLVVRIARQGGDDGRQILFQQVAAVPVGDDHGGGTRPSGALRTAARSFARQQIGDGQQQNAQREEEARVKQRECAQEALQQGHDRTPGLPVEGSDSSAHCGAKAAPSGRVV